MIHRNSNSCFLYKSREIEIGRLRMGGENPILVQSMTNTPTMDTKATVEQIIRIFDAGADIVRITARSIAEARNLENIKKELTDRNYNNPLVADIHFDPLIAIEASKHVEKIRINPGNYVNLFPNNINYTESEYCQELEETAKVIKPLIENCKQYGTAIRVGINHGSLSKRVVSKYGDTLKGMVESAIEYMKLFADENFNNLVISMKASDVRTMIWSNRLLVCRMQEEGFNYPLHIGVTEAGEGEDGRIKSAIGIGTLLLDNIGNTIRVSLTEAPENEISIAKDIIAASKKIKGNKNIADKYFEIVDPFAYKLNEFEQENNIVPDVICSDGNAATLYFKTIDDLRNKIINSTTEKLSIGFDSNKLSLLDFFVGCGSVFADGQGNEIVLNKKDFDNAYAKILSLLQSCKRRISTAEFISCPSCGRTVYNIQSVIAEVKKNFSHLRGVSIAVMGCIVNGPGEMAGAMYGCVGSKPNCVHIYYKGKIVRKNINENEVPQVLKEVMIEKGDYYDAK